MLVSHWRMFLCEFMLDVWDQYSPSVPNTVIGWRFGVYLGRNSMNNSVRTGAIFFAPFPVVHDSYSVLASWLPPLFYRLLIALVSHQYHCMAANDVYMKEY